MAKNQEKSAERSFKKVESTFADPWQPALEGDVLIGLYVGSDEADGRKPGEKFRVWKIRDDNSKVWSIAGAQLKTIMAQIPRNTYVRVTYLGKEKVASGNEMRVFGVECDSTAELQDPYHDDSEL